MIHDVDMQMKTLTKPLLLALVSLAAASVHATTINFDDQGLIGPSSFVNATPSPQTLNISAGGVMATLSGGVILRQATNLPVNATSIYGTADFGVGTLNPLTVTFSQAVQNIFFDVINGQPASTFSVTDNLGNVQVFSLPDNLSGGMVTIGLVSTATTFQISQNNGSSPFDFFIDNIHFNEAAVCTDDSCAALATSVPEPGSLALLALGLGGLAASRKRKQA